MKFLDKFFPNRSPKPKLTLDAIPSASDPHTDLGVLDLIVPTAVCAEIGVFKGEFSQLIAEKIPQGELHLIDPWASQMKPEYRGRLYAQPPEKMDIIYKSVVDKFKKHNNVNIYRDYSLSAVNRFNNGFFDWIYIDGNHDYEHALNDLKAWYPKLKQGGFLVVDDYGVEGWRTVTRAVEVFTTQVAKAPVKTIGEGSSQQAVVQKK